MANEQKSSGKLPARRRQPATPQAVTPARRETFLRTLARTGSFAAAARAASPSCRTGKGATSTFRALERRDAEFAEQVAEAEAEATGKLEKTAFSRAVEGVRKPVFQNGQLVGHVREHSDNLLLRLLEARDPEKYSRKSDVNLRGQVNHAVVGMLIRPEDLMCLNEAQQGQLEEILGVIADAREEDTDAPAD